MHFLKKNKITLDFYGIPHHQPKNILLTDNQITTLKQIIQNTKNIETNSPNRKNTSEQLTTILKELHHTSILNEKQYKTSTNILTKLNKISEKNHHANNPNSTNFLSLIIGHTTNTNILNIAELSCTILTYILIISYFIAKFIGIGDTLYSIITTLREIHTNYQNLRPKNIPVLGNIALGTRQKSPSPPNQLKTYPATGWIKSSGLTGLSTINGSFIGSIRSLTSPLYDYLTYFIGATGFIGLSITQNDGSKFFLGVSLHQKTIYWPQPPYP